MDINTLKIFNAVAQTGSITGAAKQLHYVQSNVTARIRQLEEHLETRLFNRQSRGVTLTASGKVLLKYATLILRKVDDAEQAIKDFSLQGGVLNLGAMETAAAVRLPKVLSRFHAEYPKVEISMKVGTSEEMINLVLDYGVDLAFVGFEVNNPNLERKRIFLDKLVVAGCKSNHDALEKQPVTALLFKSGCAYRERFEQWMRQTGQLPFRVIELGSFDGILACVRGGMGVTILPESTFQQPQYKNHFSLAPLPGDLGRISTHLIYRKDVLMTGAMKNFIEMVKETAYSLGQ